MNLHTKKTTNKRRLHDKIATTSNQEHYIINTVEYYHTYIFVHCRFLLLLAQSNALLTCSAMLGSTKSEPDVQDDAGDIGRDESSLLSAFELI